MKFFVRLSFILILVSASAEAEIFQSTERHATLVELYSSEGCSDCPPADEWIGKLRQAGGLWKKYVPIVFHVDYWDGLGWKDPFGSPQFTKRQDLYARISHGGTLFTPCVLMNGQVWASWQQLREPPFSKDAPGILKVETQGPGRYRVIFQPSDRQPQSYEAHIVLLGFDIESGVTKGENAGKKLNHNFVVLQYQHTVMDGSTAPAAALNLNTHDSRAKKFGVAAWVTKTGNPFPLQATGGYLD